MLEEPEDSGTTPKEDVKKTPAIMLPSILSIVNDHDKFSIGITFIYSCSSNPIILLLEASISQIYVLALYDLTQRRYDRIT